jgi:hypothetical protein
MRRGTKLFSSANWFSVLRAVDGRARRPLAAGRRLVHRCSPPQSELPTVKNKENCALSAACNLQEMRSLAHAG